MRLVRLAYRLDDEVRADLAELSLWEAISEVSEPRRTIRVVVEPVVESTIRWQFADRAEEGPSAAVVSPARSGMRLRIGLERAREEVVSR
jgi:hypothetical protein